MGAGCITHLVGLKRAAGWAPLTCGLVNDAVRNFDRYDE
jgi:hypothetical protein